jgi:hypothetical protein
MMQPAEKPSLETALRLVHRFNLSGHEAQRISQRITHPKTLLEELK